MSAQITVRPFVEEDTPEVRDLFISVNRQLAPPNLYDAFEDYIARALVEEIDRIAAYYGEKRGGFWVAIKDYKLLGTFGLERASPDAMELRRMYVDAAARRAGIARQMLQFAENDAAEFANNSVSHRSPLQSYAPSSTNCTIPTPSAY